jgi:hypothetical protein
MLTFVSLLLLGVASQENPSRADVYAIYSQMMSTPPASSQNDRYVIAATTRLPLGSVQQPPCNTPPPAYAARWAEVLDDFNARRDKPAALMQLLTISKPYIFLTPEEESRFKSARSSVLDLLSILPSSVGPSGQPGVATARTSSSPPLDPKFQGVTDIFSLGDVYFSKDRTLALTGITTWCGGLCGSSQWRIYEKLPNSSWVSVRPERDCAVLF